MIRTTKYMYTIAFSLEDRKRSFVFRITTRAILMSVYTTSTLYHEPIIPGQVLKITDHASNWFRYRAWIKYDTGNNTWSSRGRQNFNEVIPKKSTDLITELECKKIMMRCLLRGEWV